MVNKIIIANWKMHKSDKEAAELSKSVSDRANDMGVDVVLCPSSVSLKSVSENVKGKVKVGAQDIFYEDEGAFTGEISAVMIKDFAEYCMIGHSERRQYFNETDENVNKKIKKALEHGLIPIVCVGETLEEKDSGKSKEVVERMLKKGLEGIDITKVIVAYEPVWGLSTSGTGQVITTESIVDIHTDIKKFLKKEFDTETSLCYGGSVNPKNAQEILSLECVDGALVGGASLKVESFIEIVKITDSI